MLKVSNSGSQASSAHTIQPPRRRLAETLQKTKQDNLQSEHPTAARGVGELWPLQDLLDTERVSVHIEYRPLRQLVFCGNEATSGTQSNSTSNNAGSAKNPGFQFRPYQGSARSKNGAAVESNQT